MLSKVKTCYINGLVAADIEVEVDISNGLPALNIVGLPDVAVKESKERVRAALINSGFSFPMKRITINLSPADVKKEGTHFDLPIALALLSADEQIELKEEFEKAVVLGELSLDGKVKRVYGVLPMLLEAKKRGFTKMVIPTENIEEAKILDGVEIISVDSLKQLIEGIKGIKKMKTFIGNGADPKSELNQYYDDDFCNISGQENLKRALEIAAAGSHNVLMIGPPGSGKTLAAKSLPSILPSLSFDEALEITKIYSVAGILDEGQGLVKKRPFRSPHHTSSMVSITGGGRIPKPGEVSLSNYGVLFLDETPEFNRNTLEVLRQPLEDGKITISRANGTFSYPANFMLVCSMNPCPCGFYGTDSGHQCTCSPGQISRYIGKISGPLLDRIDLVVETTAVSYGDLTKKNTENESSKQIRERVEYARQKQAKRYDSSKIISNSQLSPALIKTYCKLDKETNNILKEFFHNMNLSARALNRIIKVSRTIADLDQSEQISSKHMLEAMQYRSINSLFWR
ncbi:YifB family Mg chelatase-like AAA ATPase [Serpentinicella sp. ANB-PHB4]|uniref:YifB family Mg chelatase-like AAA ATPase n=1 Tax=Serpentinicella sp. ANB-PHB4 TaxID=3074076 RepID=UPI0028586024|nr:YifB family Mg chelatase-like AAA ATPase [Serpentinicella sp. ANB-PHB4]MDR5658278.1 YifB family Mg chelatase-like AAA ATPase [Serpentinicella sp. ANB-PHB4]